MSFREKLTFSQDYKSFIHVTKTLKTHTVQRDNAGESAKTLYKGVYRAFEEDFEYYDYEISIGQVALGENQHMIHANEEKDPLRKSHQLLT